jgi:predicted enzyme related to lactoylglutathione lyase
MVTHDTPWPAGTPCWVDISVDDVPRATAFYSGLFGWDIEQGGPETGGYCICHLNGRIVAGLGPKMGDPSAPSSWTTYLASGDVDATAGKVKAAGGQLPVPPTDVMSEGRLALAFDTAGVLFGLWQGRNTPGIGLASEPGALTWNEHLSADFEGSKAFYQAVFGYGYDDMSGEDFKYATITVDGNVVGGIGGVPEGRPPGWGVYFAVADTDAAAAAAVERGATVVQPVRDSPYGRVAVIADPQGAVLSLIKPPGA